jgi:hypothetical protein
MIRSGCDIKISNGYRLKFSIMKASFFKILKGNLWLK